MATFRIAATRFFLQPARQFTVVRPVQRFASLPASTTSFTRQFHQTWRSLAAEETKLPTEETAEPQQEEPSIAEQAAIREESVIKSEAADAASESSAAQSITEQVKDFASSAASTIQGAAESVKQAATGRKSFGDRALSEPTKNLYIGNLYFETTADTLKREFSRFGEISSAYVVEDARGLSRGFGFVQFNDVPSATKAQEAMHQTIFEGRNIAVQFAQNQRSRANASPERPRQETEPSNSLFIGNMAFQMSDRDLNDLFRDVKNVLDVRVAIDRRTGQPRGFAHADFIDVESAAKAKAELSRKVVYGRQLRVDFARNATSRNNAESSE